MEHMNTELRQSVQDPFGVKEAAMAAAVNEVFAPKDFSAVREAALGNVAVDPFQAPQVELGDLQVNVEEAQASQFNEAARVAVANFSIEGMLAQQRQEQEFARAIESFLEAKESEEDEEEQLANA